MTLQASFTQRRVRMLTGLVMFAYITIHLVNHALGIVSLSLAESGLRVEMAFWRSPPITLLLYGAAHRERDNQRDNRQPERRGPKPPRGSRPDG